MSDIQTIKGSETERLALRAALTAHREQARKRYDPTFTPKPGKRDRNLLTMQVCDELMELTGAPGVLAVDTNDDHRRAMRMALTNYGNAALDLAGRIPDTVGVEPTKATQGEAEVIYTGARRY